MTSMGFHSLFLILRRLAFILYARLSVATVPVTPMRLELTRRYVVVVPRVVGNGPIMEQSLSTSLIFFSPLPRVTLPIHGTQSCSGSRHY